MIKKIFTIVTASFLEIFLIVVLCSCGSLQDEYINGISNIVFNKNLIGSKGSITYLTKELIDNEKAEPNSYLVAFRTQPNNVLPYLMGYKSEKFTFYKEIYHNVISERDVKVVNFLTSFDVNDTIEGLYYIDKKNKASLDVLGNVDDIRNLTADKYNVLNNLFFNGKNLSSTKIVALAEVRFTDYKLARNVIDRWNSKGIIEYAEPNYYNTLYDEESWQTIHSNYKNTLENTTPYWHSMINLKDAYSTLASQGKKITHPIVAVFDSGTDVEHPQLKNHIWHNPGVGIANCGEDLYGCHTASVNIGVLGDGNVYPVGASGYNSKEDEAKKGGHGTHVAGIISSDFTSNGEASYGGVCPVCKIMVVKQVNNEGKINDTAIVRGFKYISYFQDEANPDGIVRIVNASLGKVDRSRSVGIMLSKLKNTPKGKGVLVVAAAGNSDTNMYTYMAAFPEALAVSNIGKDYKKHSSSNYGRWVNIAAPGDSIYSTMPAGLVKPQTGTSMASPVVAGVAGLVVSVYPEISQEELKKVLMVSSNSVKLYEANPLYNMSIPGEEQQYHLLGIGLVDANLAVQKGTSQGNLYYTSQDRFTGLCGSINVMKADGVIEHKDKIKKGINEIVLFLVPVLIALLIGLRRKKIFITY